MTDKPRPSNGSNIQKPNAPDQTRGQKPYSPPQKPVAPIPPPAKPKK